MKRNKKMRREEGDSPVVCCVCSRPTVRAFVDSDGLRYCAACALDAPEPEEEPEGGEADGPTAEELAAEEGVERSAEDESERSAEVGGNARGKSSRRRKAR